jgi:hypothetical protein
VVQVKPGTEGSKDVLEEEQPCSGEYVKEKVSMVEVVHLQVIAVVGKELGQQQLGWAV